MRDYDGDRGGGGNRGSVRIAEGVDVHFVCDGIPVVYLEDSSIFTQYASWMLQTALGVTGKAGTLYEYTDNPKVLKACVDKGIDEDHLRIVRLKPEHVRHVLAVGLSGKRAVVLAAVLALAMDRSYHKLDRLLEELGDYDLAEPFLKLLRCSRPSRKGSSRALSGLTLANPGPRQQGRTFDVEGIHVELSVKGLVPVVELAASSLFMENISWLLQACLVSTMKVDSLFTYCEDQVIRRVCDDLGLSSQHVMCAHLERRDLQHIWAVGVNGRRSVVAALVVALALHDLVDVEQVVDEVTFSDHKILKPFLALMRQAHRAAGIEVERRWKHRGQRDTYEPEAFDPRGQFTRWNRKRKRAGCNDDDDNLPPRSWELSDRGDVAGGKGRGRLGSRRTADGPGRDYDRSPPPSWRREIETQIRMLKSRRLATDDDDRRPRWDCDRSPPRSWGRRVATEIESSDSDSDCDRSQPGSWEAAPFSSDTRLRLPDSPWQ